MTGIRNLNERKMRMLHFVSKTRSMLVVGDDNNSRQSSISCVFIPSMHSDIKVILKIRVYSGSEVLGIAGKKEEAFRQQPSESNECVE